MNANASYSGFQTTQWTLVDDLRADAPERRRAAEERLCASYWPCVYSFYRASGHARDRAQDLAQAFFTTVVLHRELFLKADRSRGRLRSLLRTALRNFEIEQHRKDARSAASLTITESAINAEESILQSISGVEADDLFDRRWAMTIVAEARDLCEEHFRAKGKSAHWELFRNRVLDPATASTTPHALNEIHADYGFDTSKAAAAAVQTVKRRFAELLQELTADDPEIGALLRSQSA